jgi:hypothetical protein
MQRVNPVNPVNLALLPKVEYGHAWCTLDAEVADRVRKLHRAAARIQNSIKFMWFSGSGDKALHCAAEEAGRLREGFLRAALAELVSVEGVLKRDLKDLGRSDPPLSMYHTPLPHLHLVRELRNHELHLYHSRLSGFSCDRLWGDITKPENASPIIVSLWVLEGVTPESVGKLDNVKRCYSDDEIRVMVKWFNNTQAEWGVHEILLRAANSYAEALCAEYFPLTA